MDHRYAYQSGKSQISKWLRDLIQTNNSFLSLEYPMRAFYHQMSIRGFTPKLKQLEQLQLELDNEEENTIIKQSLLRSLAKTDQGRTNSTQVAPSSREQTETK